MNSRPQNEEAYVAEREAMVDTQLRRRGICDQRVLEAAYTFHAYGRSTIGSRSDIEHVPMERLAAFYQKYYQPDDALLTVAGKFDEPKTIALIAEMYSKIPRPARKLEQTYTEEPTQDGERTVTLLCSNSCVDDERCHLQYHGGPAPNACRSWFSRSRFRADDCRQRRPPDDGVTADSPLAPRPAYRRKSKSHPSSACKTCSTNNLP